MYENIENFSETVPGFIAIFLAIAGYWLGHAVFRPNYRRLRRAVRVSRVLFWVAVVFGLLDLFLVGTMWTYGWVFAENRVLVALPPLVAPFVVASVLSLPRMRRVIRADADRAATPTAPVRAMASDPKLVVPIQTTAIGAALSFYTVFFARPVAPYWPIALILDGILVVLAVALWLRQQRKQRIWSGETTVAGPRLRMRLLRTAGTLVVIAGLVFGVLSYLQSSSVLPASYSMGTSDDMDYGGGPAGLTNGMAGMQGTHGMAMGGAGTVSVPQLTGDISGKPDDVFTLTAEEKRIRLDSGKVVDAWTYNGQVPGPQLTVHQGDLVQVTLVNEIPGIGVTIHWHGLDIPNAEDGVPGVTQNAVRTGQSYTYTFRVNQVGTFWYHSHQNADTEVSKGLYGALVILPKQEPKQPANDITVLAHDWGDLNNEATLNDADDIEHHTMAPGTPVRLRLINTTSESAGESIPTVLGVTGTSFKVAAIDGNDLDKPTDLASGTLLRIGSGGRNDVTFTMPDHPVRLTDLVNPNAGLVLSPNGTGTVAPPSVNGPVFDPAGYGSPAPTPFNANSHFDRDFTITLDDGPGYYNGSFYFRPTINGQTFPDTPMLMVREGDLVKVTLIDKGHNDHPMHLHGHTALVLSKDGKPVTGSPWWTDTLDIEPGQTYQIAFRADNPGIWMDHCHNLYHAAMGMIMHLAYEGVTTPYQVGSATGNSPE